MTVDVIKEGLFQLDCYTKVGCTTICTYVDGNTAAFYNPPYT